MEELFLRYVFQDSIDLDEAYQVERSSPLDIDPLIAVIQSQVSHKKQQVSRLSASKAACPRICIRNVPVGKPGMESIIDVVKIGIIVDNTVRKFILQLMRKQG